MDELDRRLEKLALEAQCHLASSRERQFWLTKLTNELRKSGKLRCGNSYNLSPDVYQEVLNEALQQTFLEVFERIEEYDPNAGTVLPWVFSRLKWRFVDACNEYRKLRYGRKDGERVKIYEQSLDIPVSRSSPETSNLSLLDTVPQPEPESRQDDWERLRNLIEKDPTGKFQQTHIDKHPEASFQAISLRRFQGQSWQVISAEWGIPLPTLSRFYQRCIDKFKPIFTEHL